MAGEKLDKDMKEIAVAVIEASGKTYEEWLNREHEKIIYANAKIIKEGLNLRKEMIILTSSLNKLGKDKVLDLIQYKLEEYEENAGD